MGKMLIIEPHGDDAYISMFSLLDTENNKHILTLSGRDSKGISDIFCNITTEYLDLEDLDYSLKPKISTHDIHRKFINGEDVYSYYKSHLIDSIENYKSTVAHIENILYDYKDSYDEYYFPVGLEHPYHMAVSEACDRVFRGKNIFLYSEKPYSSKRYNKEICESYLGESVIKTIYDLTEEQKSKKSNNFLKIYPTEGSLLVWTRKSVLEDPDIIYERR